MQPNYRKYVQGYGFLSFAKRFGNKYGKKSIDTTKKEGINFGKIAGKRVSKNVEATGDLIGNKIADKIISLGKKTKNEEQQSEEIIIPPEKKITNY